MFVRPEVEVIKFEAIDVIATSGDNGGWDGPIMNENEMILPDG